MSSIRGITDIRERIERFVSYGHPTCDVCYNLSQEERPDESEFWPDAPVHYIRGQCDSAVEFWGVTVCSHHDEPEFHPEDATHRVTDSPRYTGDRPNNMNSAYEHRVTDIQEMDK
jgi:hypothetical protein